MNTRGIFAHMARELVKMAEVMRQRTIIPKTGRKRGDGHRW